MPVEKQLLKGSYCFSLFECFESFRVCYGASSANRLGALVCLGLRVYRV